MSLFYTKSWSDSLFLCSFFRNILFSFLLPLLLHYSSRLFCFMHPFLFLHNTSISSLYLNSGASIMFLSLNVSLSTSKLCSVRSVICFQCRGIIALLDIRSSNGQHSLKSSMVFFRSKKACHSFTPRGSLRHLCRNNASFFKQFQIFFVTHLTTVYGFNSRPHTSQNQVTCILKILYVRKSASSLFHWLIAGQAPTGSP